MKFTLNWLKDHLETDASLAEIDEALTSLGLEVEEIENPAEKYAAFTLAHVISAEPHPDADKLRVCKVETKDGEFQVVCGAPNARTGMKAVFAPVGAYVPGLDFTLTKAKIRGVESHGMLVSEREMELSDEHDGIIDLETDAAIGTPFVDLFDLDDPVIEIAITPNRPDCLGVRGIARDLAAKGLGTLKADPVKEIAATIKDEAQVAVKFSGDADPACSLFVGRIVRGVKNGPSPDWMQRRLTAIGLRPISALVDITNYISYDRGRPLHVYDLAKVTGTVHARLGVNGEEVLGLDGETHKVDGDICVIADDKGVVGIGGVMGGEESGCTETTTDVLIESAWFDPIVTATAGRKLNIESDARYRFERGVDPDFVVGGAEQATDLILQICGGEAGPLTIAGEKPKAKDPISFNLAKIKKLIGIDIAEDEAVSILQSLGFEVEGSGDTISVTQPGWRPDIEGEADLVEEVARVHGLDNIPAVPPLRAADGAVGELSPLQNRIRAAKRLLASRGGHEVVTWSFMASGDAKLFGGGNALVTIQNPITSELDVMRPNILPNLIKAVGRNVARGNADLSLFEVSGQYQGDQPDDQTQVAAMMRRGQTPERHWTGGRRAVDVFDAKADALAVIAELGGPAATAQVVAEAPSWYHPGRSGTIRLGPKNVLAYFGEIHPKILKALDVDGPLVACEVFVENIPMPKKKSASRPALEASDFQAATRDFAFVVASDVAAGDVLKAAMGADKKLITDGTVFDVFEGASLGEGKKSIAITIRLQSDSGTLTEEDLDGVADKVVKSVAKATGGELRG